MIRLDQYEQAVKLLREGNSYRKVARITRLSDTTVLKIKTGKYKTFRKLDDGRIAYFDYSTEIITRCPGCGGKVRVPCLKCELEKLTDRSEGTGEA